MTSGSKHKGEPRQPRRGLARSALRWTLLAAAVPVAAALAYLLAAVVGATIQSADMADLAGDPVSIYVASNGFHGDIVLPVMTGSKDWRPLLAASPITRERVADTRWVAFGWGSEAAYTQLGKLTDLTPSIVVKALAFDRSVVHVAPLATVASGDGIRRVQVSGAGYRRLVAAIEDSFALDAERQPILLPGVSHGYGDSFFRGRRRFSLFRSCNVWVGDALRTAGIRAGIWTPFAQSLIWAKGLHER